MKSTKKLKLRKEKNGKEKKSDNVVERLSRTVANRIDSIVNKKSRILIGSGSGRHGCESNGVKVPYRHLPDSDD